VAAKLRGFLILSTRYQALPGNADPEALPLLYFFMVLYQFRLHRNDIEETANNSDATGFDIITQPAQFRIDCITMCVVMYLNKIFHVPGKKAQILSPLARRAISSNLYR
jgi:hypothetical protein